MKKVNYLGIFNYLLHVKMIMFLIYRVKAFKSISFIFVFNSMGTRKKLIPQNFSLKEIHFLASFPNQKYRLTVFLRIYVLMQLW